jgi:Spb1 C-terminal domain
VRALAKRMLRKRSRDELLEGAYNKYAFHDAGLPRWFAEDQRRHARWAPAHSRRAAVNIVGLAGTGSALFRRHRFHVSIVAPAHLSALHIGGRSCLTTNQHVDVLHCMRFGAHGWPYTAATIVPCRAPAVVSKEEVEAEKARLRAIDLRPIKKIAEAKARKKKRLAVRLLTLHL